MKTVFLLGAGASVDAGAPMMKDFFDKAHKLRDSSHLRQEDKEAFEDVFSAISELHHIHHKSYIDLNNIESVFSAFEMGRIINRLGGLEEKRIDRLKESMVKLIMKTLSYTVKFPVGSETMRPAGHYEHLISYLKTHIDKHGDCKVTLITFNYDIALDYALHYARLGTNYHIYEEDTSRGVSILKLHGSLNWFLCKDCNKIHIFDCGRLGRSWHPEAKNVFVDFTLLQSVKCGCNRILNEKPMLVPPTWDKTNHYDVIRNVWRRAAKEIGEAENIIVIGYSLPETDLFFRYLFALSAEKTTWFERFWVFDPNPDVEASFLKIVGPGIKNRFDFKKLFFGQAIDYLGKNLLSATL